MDNAQDIVNDLAEGLSQPEADHLSEMVLNDDDHGVIEFLVEQGYKGDSLKTVHLALKETIKGKDLDIVEVPRTEWEAFINESAEAHTSFLMRRGANVYETVAVSSGDSIGVLSVRGRAAFHKLEELNQVWRIITKT